MAEKRLLVDLENKHNQSTAPIRIASNVMLEALFEWHLLSGNVSLEALVDRPRPLKYRHSIGN